MNFFTLITSQLKKVFDNEGMEKLDFHFFSAVTSCYLGIHPSMANVAQTVVGKKEKTASRVR